MFHRPFPENDKENPHLFIDDDKVSKENFNYLHFKQERINFLMETLLKPAKSASTLENMQRFDELRQTDEFKDIEARIKNKQKVHSTEYTFFIFLTSDVNKLDTEMLKRLKLIITDEFDDDGYVKNMTLYLELLVMIQSWQASTIKSASQYLMRKILHHIKRLSNHFGSAFLNLRGVNFAGANLEGVDFAHYDLYGADFSGALFDHADFDYCVLTNANFSNATATGSGEYHHRVHIRKSILENTNFDGAKFPRVHLSDVVFKNCSFKETIMRGTSLDVGFSNFKLDKSELTFDDGSNVHFQDCDISTTIFHDMDWRAISATNTLIFKEDILNADSFPEFFARFDADYIKFLDSYVSDKRWLKADYKALKVKEYETKLANCLVYQLANSTIDNQTKCFILGTVIDCFYARETSQNSKAYNKLNEASGWAQHYFFGTTERQHKNSSSEALKILETAVDKYLSKPQCLF